ncbi:MAG TPA: HAMP domain-containing histidine kinase [Campylobacterales bacterium]|nr:HAMP domain-containing histidine kinase [Campylobacterales bacterium]
MLSEKSIRKKFILQLIAASAALIAIFSIILYSYIKISVLDEITISLEDEAKLYIKENKIKEPFSKKEKTVDYLTTTYSKNDNYKIVMNIDKKQEISYEEYKKDSKSFFTIFYPYDRARSSFLVIEKDITGTYNLFKKIRNSIIVVNILSAILILAYAFFLAETLLYPVKSINQKLARMNENFLEHIDTSTLPVEFVSLGESINKLIDRIQNFVKHQKELFIGAAHELKTPLAVMKTKNEVTMIKKRDTQKYIETLKVNNTAIDGMNSMITSILEIGRQEGAQFERPVELNVVEFLEDKAKDYKLLASARKIKINMDLEPKRYCILTQPTLLTHILQNFVQNAVKYSEEDSNILIKSRLNGDIFRIDVIDEGAGVDESFEHFAPFKRQGKQSGAGLGLFLAKGAADAIGAKLSLFNREDKKGSIASIEVNAKNFCPTDEELTKKSIFSNIKRS